MKTLLEQIENDLDNMNNVYDKIDFLKNLKNLDSETQKEVDEKLCFEYSVLNEALHAE